MNPRLTRLHSTIKNESGALTTDFLFSFFLSLAFVVLVIAITLTLSITEVTQYIAFATSRAYSASHVNIQAQEATGLAKFSELKSNRGFGALFTNGWFSIGEGRGGVQLSDFSSEFPDDVALDAATYQGARIAFVARLMSFRVPFIGSTDASGDGFTANISSYVGREPTFAECHENFNSQRWDQIQRTLGYTVPTPDPKAYVNLSDNGC